MTAGLSVLRGPLCALTSIACLLSARTADAKDNDPLAFDPKSYTIVHITVDGSPMEVRRYRVVYVAKPIRIDITKPPMGPRMPGPPPAAPGAGAPPAAAAPGPLRGGPFGVATDPLAYQTMYIYVPQSAYNDSKTAIILQVNNAGWIASAARDTVQEGDKFVSANDTDNTGAALRAGYVVVAAGTRSRGIRSEVGDWAGKLPAVIVDAKAAVRYLRYNDAVMPGSADRIVITGTSGGGGLSVAVAASGNSPDYYPYLASIGAAGVDTAGKSTVRDDVFATVAYCPINDLGNADLAYEWQYSAVRTAANIAGGQYTPQMATASATLAAKYPSYLAGLHLKRDDGSLLSADSMPPSIVEQVKKGVQAGIARGEHIPAIGEDFVIKQHRGPPPGGELVTIRMKNDWLTVENGKVTNIDYQKYVNFVAAITPLKTVPAFDASANTGNQGLLGENTLFGSDKLEYSNFTEYAWDHNEVKGDGSGPDDIGKDWVSYIAGPGPGAELVRQIKLSGPIPYLHTTASTAPYWYVRHGIIDRDTSFALQTTLYYAIKNDPKVKDLNFKLVWLQGHAGNYDVQEAYAWVADVLHKAGEPKVPAIEPRTA